MVDDVKFERLQQSFERLQNCLQVQQETMEIIDKKIKKLNIRRKEREKKVSIRKVYESNILRKIKEAKVVIRMNEGQIQKMRQKAVQNAKSGFNPFM